MAMGATFERRFVLFTVYCAAGTLVGGILYALVTARYLSGVSFGIGAAVILSTGLFIWVRGVDGMKRVEAPQLLEHPKQSRPTLPKVPEALFSLSTRIDAVLKSAWLNTSSGSGVKTRLRAVLNSWREDMMSDLPAFTEGLLGTGVQRFLKQADGVMAELELLAQMESEDQRAMEDAEEHVLDLLSYLQELLEEEAKESG